MDTKAAIFGANMAISELTESGQIGSATKLAYTYNGDPSKVIEVMGMTLVKLSDAAHDLNSITVAKVHYEGKEITAFASELEHNDYDGVSVVNVPVDDISTRGAIYYMPYDVAAMLDVPTGLYFDVDLEDDYYPTYVEFAETIKPIDPKYLGGVCLPVVTLANEAFDFSQGANIHILSTDEVAAVEAATSKAMPIAVRFNAIVGAPSTVALVFDYAETGGMVVYQGIYLTTQILLAPKAAIDEGEGWVFMTQPMG